MEKALCLGEGCALEKTVAMGRFALALFAVMGCALFSIAATATAEDSALRGSAWNDYVYSDDQFAMSAPVVPTVEKQSTRVAGGSAEAHTYTMSMGDSGAFMVFVVMRNASDQRSDQEVLDQARIGALRAANAVVMVQSNATLGPYRGSQLDLESSGNAAKKRMRDRFFVVGRRLYQLMSIAPAGESLPADTERWFDSFRLVGDGAR